MEKMGKMRRRSQEKPQMGSMVSEAIIHRLAADEGYTVHVMDTEVEDVLITNITGIMSDGEEIVDEIARADILTTAVGLRVLGFIAPTIAKGIQKRCASGTEPGLRRRGSGME